MAKGKSMLGKHMGQMSVWSRQSWRIRKNPLLYLYCTADGLEFGLCAFGGVYVLLVDPGHL